MNRRTVVSPDVPDAPRSTFGATLRRLRRLRGLSQKALAERASLSTQALSALECGLRRLPHRGTIALLADALGLYGSERARFEDAAFGARTATLRSDLPLPPRTFLGRSDELAAVAQLLSVHRLVTITGPGGIGKTSLALAAAAVAEWCEDGAIFCDVSAVRDARRLPETLAVACGLAVKRDATIVDAIATALGASSRLIVLDNCEHVVEAAAALVGGLLSRAPKIAVLATSRRLLGVAGEAGFRLSPLAVPGPQIAARLTAAGATQFGAVALFAVRAEMVDSHFSLSDENARCVARVCRRLDGLPLAIELAAAHLRLMNVAELERHLATFASRLRGLRRDGTDRHRALRTVFDWSYDLLEERERRLFRALGTFATGATFEAVHAVGGEPGGSGAGTLDTLTSLVDASLVAVDPGGDATRYRLLETTRDYARERAAAIGESDTWTSRHLDYLRATAGRKTLTHDVANVRSVLTWALHGGDVVGGADLAVRVSSFWHLPGSSAEGGEWTRAFLEALPADEVGASTRLLIALSFIERNAQHGDWGFATARAALAQAKTLENPTFVFDALRSVAVSFAIRGCRDEAERSLREAAEFLGDDETRQVKHLIARGWVEKLCGAHDAAFELFEEARTLARRFDRRELEIAATTDAAEAEDERGRPQHALASLVGVLRDGRLAGVDDEYVLANIAGYALRTGNEAAFVASARELLTRYVRELIPSLFVISTLEHVALASVARNTECATRLLGYCDAWYRSAALARGPTEDRMHERLMAATRSRLTENAVERLAREGSALDVGTAISLALDAVASLYPAVVATPDYPG